MKIMTSKYPIDIILCILLSFIIIPIVLLNAEGILRIVIGIPFILFVPGYLLIALLFPENKSMDGIDVFERIAFSFGLSMAIVPLLGIVLFYSPFGLRLETILLTLFFIINLVAVLALFRWYRTPQEKRYLLSITFSPPPLQTKLDRALVVILIITIVITIITFIFVVSNPHEREKLTEFYILGAEGKTTDYPENLSLGENASIVLGIVNHEHETINYTIEIWLINQSLEYNQSTKTNNTVYHEMWFMTKFTITLQPFTENTEVLWKPQWERPYNFSINKTGKYTLTFLLFTSPTPDYKKTENYRDIAAKKIQNAYESLYLWLKINE